MKEQQENKTTKIHNNKNTQQLETFGRHTVTTEDGNILHYHYVEVHDEEYNILLHNCCTILYIPDLEKESLPDAN